jgi:hypothetical protein
LRYTRNRLITMQVYTKILIFENVLFETYQSKGFLRCRKRYKTDYKHYKDKIFFANDDFKSNKRGICEKRPNAW